MAEFFQKRKQRDDEVLGSAVDFLLANARLVLGVGGAAVLGIATLAVKRVRPGYVGYTWGSQGRQGPLQCSGREWGTTQVCQPPASPPQKPGCLGPGRPGF